MPKPAGSTPVPAPDLTPDQSGTSSQVSDLFEDDSADEVLAAISVVETSTVIRPGLASTAVEGLAPVGVDSSAASEAASAAGSGEAQDQISSALLPAGLFGDGVEVELSLQESFQVIDVVETPEATGAGTVSDPEADASTAPERSDLPQLRAVDDETSVTRMNNPFATENLSRSDTEATDRAVRLLNLPATAEISSPSPDQIGGFLQQAIRLIKGGDLR